MDKNDIKERFEQTTGKAAPLETNTVIVDKETGIEYLFHAAGYAGGLTVLMDKEGKPRINKDYQ
ncbi:DUF6440 family protein [Lactococcus allomyrinae]|uniref:Xylan 1,4-beta-xylosidase n=1 Tax=Lactococcus allomyrinae TaxID=2419773 RepID=A0A387BC97_9LACT|nr:DUF6440 family protein [Lactococcus allomyrinae]AYG01423.1 xylan 1,4-beta-xylosidase [Lactococcus allomyrinae]